MERGQLTWRGVTWGIGTAAEIVRIKGLESLPGVDSATTLHARGDGGIAGNAYAQARIIEVELEIVAVDTAATRKLLRNNTTFSRDGVVEPLTFMIDDEEIRLYAQILRRELELTNTFERINNPVLQWECVDPRKYGTAQSIDIPFPIEGTGLSYPFTYPQPYVTVPGETGSRSIVNTGSDPTPSIITLVGPVLLPQLTFAYPNGRQAVLTIDLQLVSGETLVLDVKKNTALLNGSDRYTALGGALLSDLEFPPGETVVTFTAFTGAAGQAKATIEFAPAEM